MPRKSAPSLAKQVEKIASDRIYLRSVIQTMITVARDIPDQIKPAIIEQLKSALDHTADQD